MGGRVLPTVCRFPETFSNWTILKLRLKVSAREEAAQTQKISGPATPPGTTHCLPQAFPAAKLSQPTARKCSFVFC